MLSGAFFDVGRETRPLRIDSGLSVKRRKIPLAVGGII